MDMHTFTRAHTDTHTHTHACMHIDMLIAISYELGKVHYIEGHKVEDAFLN
jgi:hypothetical protein